MSDQPDGREQLRLLDELLHYKLGVPVAVAERLLEYAAIGASRRLARGGFRRDSQRFE